MSEHLSFQNGTNQTLLRLSSCSSVGELHVLVRTGCQISQCGNCRALDLLIVSCAKKFDKRFEEACVDDGRFVEGWMEMFRYAGDH
jgi:hypothetical protein